VLLTILHQCISAANIQFFLLLAIIGAAANIAAPCLFKMLSLLPFLIHQYTVLEWNFVSCTIRQRNTSSLIIRSVKISPLHNICSIARSLSEFTALKRSCEQINTFSYIHICLHLNHTSLLKRRKAFVHLKT
jgi:hypothetical protein